MGLAGKIVDDRTRGMGMGVRGIGWLKFVHNMRELCVNYSARKAARSRWNTAALFDEGMVAAVGVDRQARIRNAPRQLRAAAYRRLRVQASDPRGA